MNQTKTVDYVCKFCGKHGSVSAEIDPAIEVQSQKWAAMMACNRCSDHMVANYRYRGIITGWCYEWNYSRRTAFAQDQEIRIREKLVKFTKKYAENACAYFNALNQWEPYIVDALMNEPERSLTILHDYYRKVKNESKRRNNNPF